MNLSFGKQRSKTEKCKRRFLAHIVGQLLAKATSKTTGAIKLERPFATAFDPILKKVVRVPKIALVEETTKIGSTRKTTIIKDEGRKTFASRFEGRSWPHIPADEFFPGRQTNKLINGSGISHICHMYTQRALFAYGSLVATAAFVTETHFAIQILLECHQQLHIPEARILRRGWRGVRHPLYAVPSP